MEAGRGAVRLFLLLALVALPAVVAFAALTGLTPGWLDRIGTGTALLVVGLFTLIWAGIVSILGSRNAGEDVEAIVSLAERGRDASASDGEESREPSSAYQRLARALDERNRQIADLAERLRTAPIERDAQAVAHSTVASAVSVTGDPTWLLVVLRTPDPALLPTGAYGQEPDPLRALEEAHRWAATVAADDPAVAGVRYGEGPWGAFVVVEVAAGEDLRASLLAPWEGRERPSGAERRLLSLLGQSSATAIEHALLYARLRVQTEELNRMAAVQTDFLRGVTHDLQSPLTSIGALAAELQQQPGMTEGARADLETIAHQAERLRRMVSQLLVASRLEAGVLQPRQEVFRPEPLVRRTWAALRADRPFELVSTGEPRLVVADPDRFEQVLWALLDNAVKYSPEGSPVRLEIDSAAAGAQRRELVEIRVIDRGAGMEPQDAGHAFEQFYRADAARRMAPDGSGVGLYAARGIVEAMGGSVELSTTLGRGSMVTVRLPAEAAVEESSPARTNVPLSYQ
jgi:signal transduction histidine kinase